MGGNPTDRRKVALILLLVVVPILFLLGWSQASLNLSFIRPSNPRETVLLLALSAIIFLAFVIFGLILLRILLKLYIERKQQQLGSRFKTKMLGAFLSLSLVPACFLFLIAYGLLNKTIDRWFSIPLDLIRADSQEIVQQLQSKAQGRSMHIASHLASGGALAHAVATSNREEALRLIEREVADKDNEAAICLDHNGQWFAYAGGPHPDSSEIAKLFPFLPAGRIPPAGLSANWRSSNINVSISAQTLFDGSSGAALGTVLGVCRLPPKLMLISQEIQREGQKYAQLSSERRTLKRTYLSMLWLLTLLVLFIATWFALFMAKQVTVPIQALAKATQEVSKGNLGFQVSTRADDELGVLVHSFNAMTRQLQENRLAIERAAKELQAANRQLEERGNTTEAILENIPTGVISFDPHGQINHVNKMAKWMFGRDDMTGSQTLADIFTPEDARDVARLFRRAERQGVVDQQMELDLGGRRAFASLTVSSIRASHGVIGSVLVLEDLSELVQAQKAAAWQEVAQRVAHEIKNPLTPIQLSTERIRRLLDRAGALPADLMRVVTESASLVAREVATLKSLVDEFATFARFPKSHPVSSDLNAIVGNALKIFEGRLNGIQIHQNLASELPPAMVDPEQMKRAVANLIDNAAEALEQALQKEIWIQTTHATEHGVAEIIVADSGPGIAPEDKERLFLPFFSTKHRGTGLGLAIVSRIVSEHNGILRVEENQPTGTKFIIEIPVERAPADHPPSTPSV